MEKKQYLELKGIICLYAGASILLDIYNELSISNLKKQVSQQYEELREDYKDVLTEDELLSLQKLEDDLLNE